MTLGTANGCIVLPHPANWKSGVKWKRTWATAIAGGVTGAEDRSTGRTNALQRLDFTVTALSLQDQRKLTARILAALKLGRAAVPNWSRPKILDTRQSGALALTYEGSGTYRTIELIPGRLYHYSRGRYDSNLSHAGCLFAQDAFFVAIEEIAYINVLGGEIGAGTVEPVDAEAVPVEAGHLWRRDDYVFFQQRSLRDPRYQDVQRDLLINCGGSASAPYETDQLGSGGAGATTVTTVQTHLLGGYSVPPQAVLKSARNLTSTDSTAAIVYEITGLQIGIICRIRLHFAEIESGFDGSSARRRFNIMVSGDTTVQRLNFEPWWAAGRKMNSAVAVDFAMAPASDGTITITLTPATITVCGLKSTANVNLAASVSTLDGHPVGPDGICLLANQTDPSQNGVWVLNSTLGGDLHYRHADSNLGVKLVHQVVAVLVGDVHGGQFWRCDRANPFTLGTEANTWTQTTKPYNAGINAIEAYQYSWEIRQLTVSSDDRLAWTAWLKGVFAAGDQVYPILFGKLNVSDMAALTNWIGEIPLSIQEPVAEEGDVGLSACPTEECVEAPGTYYSPNDDDPIIGVGGDATYFIRINSHNTGTCIDEMTACALHPVTSLDGEAVEGLTQEGPRTGGYPGPNYFQAAVFKVNDAFLAAATLGGPEALGTMVSVSFLHRNGSNCEVESNYSLSASYKLIADTIAYQIGTLAHAGTGADPCVFTFPIS